MLTIERYVELKSVYIINYKYRWLYISYTLMDNLKIFVHNGLKVTMLILFLLYKGIILWVISRIKLFNKCQPEHEQYSISL